MAPNRLLPAHRRADATTPTSRTTGTRTRSRRRSSASSRSATAAACASSTATRFPTLFTLIDDKHDGDVHKLTAAETQRVMDACFQCKLCEVQCPYTPRDGHEFQLDFPKLVHRYERAIARSSGVPLPATPAGRPGSAGAAGAPELRDGQRDEPRGLHRWFMEKLARDPPRQAAAGLRATTFERWAEAQG